MDYEIILETVVGSTLHGTSVDDGLEDLDLMAVVIESPRHGLDLARPDFDPQQTWIHRTKPEGVRSEAGDVDWVGHALRKYMRLAMRGNPTVLLPLFAPMDQVRVIDRLGRALRDLTPKIVSKFVYSPYKHYMAEQHRRLMGTLGQKNCTRPELVEKYGFDSKYAAHIVRLGYQGKELLSTGRLTLPMPEAERQEVRDIRTGKYTIDEVSTKIVERQEELSLAFEQCSLRAEPDYEAIEAFVIQAYLETWQFTDRVEI